MRASLRSQVVALSAAALTLFSWSAWSATQVVNVDTLSFSDTVGTPLAAGDTLIVNTVVTGATGALSQSITFSVGADVGGAFGYAAWQVSPGRDIGPSLVGVNIDVLDSGNNVIVSDDFNGLTGGFALSTIGPASPGTFPLLPGGTYTLVATGNALRDTVLDISLSFAPIPEPGTIAIMLSGLGLVGFAIARRRVAASA